jgi:hypothetical protein
MVQNSIFRIDFSLIRAVFFVVIGSIVGAIVMILMITFPLYWIRDAILSHLDDFYTYYIIGIYSASSFSVIAGISVHLITVISIGRSIHHLL